MSLLVGMLLAGAVVLVFAYRNADKTPEICADPAFVVECEVQRADLRRILLGQVVSGVILSVVAVGGYIAMRAADRKARRSGEGSS